VRRFGGPTEPDGQDVHRAEPGGDSGDVQKKSDFGCHEVETSHNMNSGRRVPDLRNQHFVGGDVGTALFRPAAAVGLPEVFALRPVDEVLFGFEDGFRHQVGAVLRFQQAEGDEARNGLHRLGGILEPFLQFPEMFFVFDGNPVVDQIHVASSHFFALSSAFCGGRRINCGWQGRIGKKGAIPLTSPMKAKRLGWIVVVAALVLSVLLSVAWYLIGLYYCSVKIKMPYSLMATVFSYF